MTYYEKVPKFRKQYAADAQLGQIHCALARVRQMKRREFIALLGGLAAQPFAAQAQQSNLPVIGYLSSRSLDNSKAILTAFTTA